jgi:hypothetical protein
MMCVALMLVTTLSGCCLLGHGCMGGGGYAPYGGYYGNPCGNQCNPCQSGACGAAAPGYGYPATGMYGQPMPQAALPPAQISANMPYGGYPQQQLVMTDALPSF